LSIVPAAARNVVDSGVKDELRRTLAVPTLAEAKAQEAELNKNETLEVESLRRHLLTSSGFD
jgi:hypothetical protein